MPAFEIFVVDAFSRGPFTGNQAAVCLVNREKLTYEDQVRIASEMRHSETAFIQLINQSDSYDKSSEFNLRWFTPTTEVSLCGHATLASAAVLFNCIGNQSDCIEFHTLSGQLSASKKSCDSDVISLDFPLNPPVKVEMTDEIDNILELVTGDKSTADVQYSETTRKLLIRLEDSKYPSSLLRSISPDFKKLLECKTNVRGVIVTVKKLNKPGGDADDDDVGRPDDDDDVGRPDDDGKEEEEDDDGVDFYSRYFAPWYGIDEDPVTGSAHTVLAAYWAGVLGKKSFKAKQCSDRTGFLWLKVEDDRCEIMGTSFVVLRGTFTF